MKSKLANGIILITDENVHGVAMPLRCTPCMSGFPKECKYVNGKLNCPGFVHAEINTETGCRVERCDRCFDEREVNDDKQTG